MNLPITLNPLEEDLNGELADRRQATNVGPALIRSFSNVLNPSNSSILGIDLNTLAWNSREPKKCC